MALGNAFPLAVLRQSVVRQLVPGVVIKLTAKMDDGQIHEKRFVVVQVTDTVITCVINTAVTSFIANRPPLLRCQVDMPSTTHGLMTVPISHIDCTRVRPYLLSDVVDELVAKGTSWILGTITVALGNDIQVALKASPLIAATDAASYCASLTHASLRPE